MMRLISKMILAFACLFLVFQVVTSAPMADSDSEAQNGLFFPAGAGQGFRPSGGQSTRHGSWGFHGTRLEGRRGLGK